MAAPGGSGPPTSTQARRRDWQRDPAARSGRQRVPQIRAARRAEAAAAAALRRAQRRRDDDRAGGRAHERDREVGVSARPAGDQCRSRDAAPGAVEPRAQRLSGHAAGRDAAARLSSARRGNASSSPSRTPASAFRPSTCRRSSTSISRRRRRAAASVSRWSTASSNCTTARSKCSPRRGEALGLDWYFRKHEHTVFSSAHPGCRCRIRSSIADMKKLLLAVPLLGWLCLASACAATVKAKAPVERPNLDVPPPPPRVIEPAPVPETLPEPVPELPPPPAPAKPRPQPRPQPAEPKGESKPEQAPPETGRRARPPPNQVPQLRTPQTADGTEAEKTVRVDARAREVGAQHRQLQPAEQRAQEGVQRRQGVHPAGGRRA